MGFAVNAARRLVDLSGEIGEGLAAITDRMLFDAADLKAEDLRDPGADQIGDYDKAGVVDAIGKTSHLLGADDGRLMPGSFLTGQRRRR